MAIVCDVYCDFATFPFGILGQVWYLIVSVPGPCCLSYFETGQANSHERLRFLSALDSRTTVFDCIERPKLKYMNLSVPNEFYNCTVLLNMATNVFMAKTTFNFLGDISIVSTRSSKQFIIAS